MPDRLRSTWDEQLVSWDEHWSSAGESLRQLGRSHTEPSGRIVTIYRNGNKVG